MVDEKSPAKQSPNDLLQGLIGGWFVSRGARRRQTRYRDLLRDAFIPVYRRGRTRIDPCSPEVISTRMQNEEFTRCSRDL